MIDVFSQEARGPTVDFLAELRSFTRRAGVGIVIDLSQVNKVHPSGAVLLLAEMDRAALGQSGSTLQIARCRDPIVDAVMCQIGIYVTDEGPTVEAEREDVKHWRYATGVASEGTKGGTILHGYEGRLAEGLTSDLYAGIVEAMTNTVHHAYAGPPGLELRRFIGKRWWALSQERDGELTIAICDLGIGIPRSLPRSATFPQPLVRAAWQAMGLDRSDANAIKVALELGRTSTGQKGRGRGLSEIMVFIPFEQVGLTRHTTAGKRGEWASSPTSVRFHACLGRALPLKRTGSSRSAAQPPDLQRISLRHQRAPHWRCSLFIFRSSRPQVTR
ncbi:MAG: hypothetical protein JWM75_2563 [Sphingomonas bacterium]|nr:hypothetical protein [Sphingomonas bacterium]